MQIIDTIRKAKVAIKAEKDNTFMPVLEFFDSLDEPTPLTGWTFTLTLRQSTAPYTVVETWTAPASFTVVDNKIIFNKLVTLNEGTYKVDITGTNGAGQIITIVEGTFEVRS